MACAKHIVRNAKAARTASKPGLGDRVQRALFHGKKWNELSKKEKGDEEMAAGLLGLVTLLNGTHSYVAARDAGQDRVSAMKRGLKWAGTTLGVGGVAKMLGSYLQTDYSKKPGRKG